MEQTSVTQESKGFYKLNWLQRIGFGSGDLAQNLIYQTICMYLLFFYTDIYGLNPGVAATMFLVVRLVDVLWDPLVGTYVDKHNPRWGKYRSYLVWQVFATHSTCHPLFWNGMEGQTETIKLIYAYVTYMGLSMLYTLINVPYGALNSSLTPRYRRDNHSHLCTYVHGKCGWTLCIGRCSNPSDARCSYDLPY